LVRSWTFQVFLGLWFRSAMYDASVQVAYLVTSYRPPQQLLRLLWTLRRAQPEAPIVVHHDRFRTQWDIDLVAPIGGVHVLTSETPVSWGDFSVVNAIWVPLSWMVENLEFDWVVLLSEQDYPIVALEELEQRLSASGVDAFIEAEPIRLIADPNARKDRDLRYNYRYAQLPHFGLMARLPPAVRRQVARVGNKVNGALYELQQKVTAYVYPDGLPLRVGFRPKGSPFSETFLCWYGPMQMALSHRAAVTVTEYVASHRDYVRHYARTVIPDESATATIVCNDPTLKVWNGTLHWTKWTVGDHSHPDVLVLDDLGDLAGSGKFFARKFDIGVDSSVLDALDQRIFGS
jgi:Core-2/I-Branching enzyme